MFTTLELVSVVFYFIISIIVVASNLLVIISILVNRKLRTPPSLLLVSLAMADLSAGAIAIPFRISEVYRAPFTLNVDYCRVSHCFTLLNITGSILNLVAIAIERFIAIEYPYKYIELMSQKVPYPIFSIMITWTIVIGITFLPLYAWGSNGKHGPRAYDIGICKFNETLDQRFIWTILLGIVSFSILIITTLNIRIYVIARRQMKRVTPLPTDRNQVFENSDCFKVTEENLNIDTNNNGNEQNRSRRSSDRLRPMQLSNQTTKHLCIGSRGGSVREDGLQIHEFQRKRRKSFLRSWKTTKTMFTMSFAFLACWLAFIIPTSIFLNCPPCANGTIVILATIVIFASGALNPFIFYLRMKLFRKETKKTFAKLVGRR